MEKTKEQKNIIEFNSSHDGSGAGSSNLLANGKFQQAFMELADEPKKECGDWKGLPSNSEFIANLMKWSEEQENKKRTGNIPVP